MVEEGLDLHDWETRGEQFFEEPEVVKHALRELDVVTLELDEEVLRDVDTPQELRSAG